MRFLRLKSIFVFVSISLTTAKAISTPLVLTTGAASLALTIGEWLLKDSKQAYYIQVQSSGATREDALNEGFRLAVDRAVGTLVISEIDIKNDAIVRNTLLKHSSGFIHDFNIKSEKSIDGKTYLVIDAWVSESKITNKVLSKGTASGEIDGSKGFYQYQSLKSQETSSTDLTASVLGQFSKNAFLLKQGQPETLASSQGIIFTIPVTISWNPSYYDALTELLERTKDGSTTYAQDTYSSIISYTDIGSGKIHFASYRNPKIPSLISRSIFDNTPQLKVDLLDASDNSLFSTCTAISGLSGEYRGNHEAQEMQFIANYPPKSNFGLYGNFLYTTTVQINLGEKSSLAKSIKKVSSATASKAACFDAEMEFSRDAWEVNYWCRRNPESTKKYCQKN